MPEFTPTLNAVNLRAGLARWDDLAIKGNWPADLHAAMYSADTVALSAGLTTDWWDVVVPRLSAWRAIRPLRTDAVRQSGLEALPEMSVLYGRLASRRLGFDVARWEDVCELFDVAGELKPTRSRSPVFGSKLCHFMLPPLFPVIDRAAVGWNVPYGQYWTARHNAWVDSRDRHGELRAIVDTRIPEAHRPFFPYATKISELCIVGERTGRAQQ